MICLYILIAVLIFSVLIFVHELGHFLAAKLFGVRVNEFSLCMGPAIWKKTIGETTYALRCIPIGGYCAMEGEDESSDDPGAFTSAKPWKRVVILIAGSAMNFVTGLLVLIIVFSTVTAFATPKISGFMDGCPLVSEQGLQVGDVIHRIDGERVYLHSDLNLLLPRNTTGIYDLEVKRDGRIVKLDDFSIKKQQYEENSHIVERYGLNFTVEQNSVLGTLRQGWNSALNFCRLVRLSLQDLISGRASVQDVSGPVGIVSVIANTGKDSETAGEAAMNIGYLAAFIAVNLAVMNMLPIPALDGGRVFFLIVTTLIEKIIRRKIDPKYEGYIHGAGMILLLGLIALITLKDVWGLFVR